MTFEHKYVNNMIYEKNHLKLSLKNWVGGFIGMVEIMTFGQMEIGKNQYPGIMKSMKNLLVQF